MLVIGITSYTKCGKDYVGNELAKELVKHGYKVRTVAFATILKRIVADFLDIPSISVLDKEKDNNMLYMFGLNVMSVRDILIKVAQVIRKRLGDEVFIKPLIDYIKNLEGEYDVVIVNDIRFRSEAEALKNNFKYCKLIRIVSDLKTCTKTVADKEVDSIEVDMNFINVTNNISKFRSNLKNLVSILTTLIEKSKK